MQLTPDPGSFRDPTSRVVHDGPRVLRLFNHDGDLDRAAAWAFIQAQSRDGEIIASTLVDAPEAGATSVVEHPRLDFVSHPFEWSFTMLQDAALLHLRLIRAASLVGLGMKDASPYNVQFVGTDPVFIDIGSFEPREPSEPWVGYRQFCEMFLFPLMLRSHAGIAFQPLLRGSVNGISVDQANAMLGGIRAGWRRGRTTHLLLQHFALRKLAQDDGELAKDLSADGVNSELLRSTVDNMSTLVSKLSINAEPSEWSGYSARNHYTASGLRQKQTFVREKLGEIPDIDHCWDVGCNDGLFSRIASEHAKCVLAMDADEVTIDRLYTQLRSETTAAATRITPLVADLTTANGGVGWRGTERRGLDDRSRPDAVLYLAVIHHLAFTFNIPLEHQLDWLADVTPHLIVEFPSEHDPLVEQLAARKSQRRPLPYDTETFESALSRRFDVRDSLTLDGGTRTLYFARRLS